MSVESMESTRKWALTVGDIRRAIEGMDDDALVCDTSRDGEIGIIRRDRLYAKSVGDGEGDERNGDFWSLGRDRNDNRDEPMHKEGYEYDWVKPVWDGAGLVFSDW